MNTILFIGFPVVLKGLQRERNKIKGICKAAKGFLGILFLFLSLPFHSRLFKS